MPAGRAHPVFAAAVSLSPPPRVGGLSETGARCDQWDGLGH